MQFKKRGGRKEIITPDGMPWSGQQEQSNEPLAVAIARAHHWQDLLDNSRYPSITALAEVLGVDRSYVGRMLRLTSLAPDIVEAVLRGQEPSGMSLRQLVARVPVVWEEQRSLFGHRPSSRSNKD